MDNILARINDLKEPYKSDALKIYKECKNGSVTLNVRFSIIQTIEMFEVCNLLSLSSRGNMVKASVKSYVDAFLKK